MFKLVADGFELITGRSEFATRAFESVTPKVEIAICEFELVDLNVTHAFEIALLNFNSCF